ncbi:HAD family hydrolase [Pacificimonas flava]|uniref:HAD-superfamily hydrolase, subfamily IA, variant 3 n=1 Tax=Pacificimonas flava TaxID=1234595 RepID=M2SF62_9SPHN|nr:HAD family phosphatase [Pacificimonas flava]EMD83995.1 HAD-superfamily hydrolase, subfamily IA, variant 3 [Pacificimonas flava]MBB5281032.1 HAD superfamily hydrolase (TIGR01509 family) [Pacificimonas flava]
MTDRAEAAIIFDFDGVLVDSELAENRHIAETLSDLGRPTDLRDAIREFTGLSGLDFVRALERWMDGPVPAAFDERRREQSVRLMRTGIDAVPGALAFVAALAPTRKIAIVSSSSTEWLRAHLAHLGLAGRFEPHLYSGKEHVERGKPAPDVYLYAARALGAAPSRCFVIEDSIPGVTAAAAAGMHVCGLLAAGHIAGGPDDDAAGRDEHGRRLLRAGASVLAVDYEEVAAHLAAFEGEEQP